MLWCVLALHAIELKKVNRFLCYFLFQLLWLGFFFLGWNMSLRKKIMGPKGDILYTFSWSLKRTIVALL